jgi:hypothetical protein
LNGLSGKLMCENLPAVPNRSELINQLDSFDFTPISAKRIELESRILYAYEVDDACVCDVNICRL